MENITEAAVQMGASARINTDLASAKWRKFLEMSKVPEDKQSLVARLCENQLTWMDSLTEETHIASIGSFEKYVFPMIRSIYPNLIAADLVSVQPMESPTSLVFYRDTRFGTTKGSITEGDPMFSSRTGWNDQAGFHYSDEVVEGETLTAADPFSGTLGFHPVRPGSVTLTWEAFGAPGVFLTATDDGLGNITGPTDVAAAGTINYATGAIAGLNFTAGVPISLSANYDYNSEANLEIPQIDLVLTSAPVVARPRKLRARWSIEAAAQLKAVHGDEAEVELMTDMANEVRIEVDREVINDLFTMAIGNDGGAVGAAAGTGVIPKTVFDTSPDTGVSLYLHRQSFVYALIEASNAIFRATRRSVATWILAGTNVVNILQGQEGEQFVPSGYDIQGSGVQFTGTFKGQWKVYHDPYLNPNIAIVGFKGNSFLDAGYVYAPWIPMYATPTVYLDDFIGRKGIFTSYAKKPINALYYTILELQDIP